MRKLSIFILALGFALQSFANTDPIKKTVIIDVGHGGKDNGAEIHNVKEKELCLAIAQKIQNAGEADGINVIITRNLDTFISLEDRAKQINEQEADAVLSLHINFSDDLNKNGIELFIPPASERSIKLATKLAIEFMDVKVRTENLYLLKNVDKPIVMLELGYLSNDGDRANLTSDEGQWQYAKKIVAALKE